MKRLISLFLCVLFTFSLCACQQAAPSSSEAPDQQEEISLTVHLDSERFPTVEIQLYRYDGTNCLAVVDGESVSLVPREQVVDLTEAVRAIVLN